MGRMRTLVSFIGGAVTVGFVVGALAVAGVIDDDAAQPSAAPAAIAPSGGGKAPPSPKPGSVADIYRRVSPSVAFVSSSTSGGGAGGGILGGGQGGGNAATGSGFVYDDQGHIVTNDHVVEGFNTFSVRIGSNETPIPAKLAGKDPSSDLAVLKIDPSAVPGGLHPLELGGSDALQPGDQATAIGSPFGPPGAPRDSASALPSAWGGRSPRASCPRSGARSRHPTASRSPTRCRPTRRSTQATPAARCSTATAA